MRPWIALALALGGLLLPVPCGAGAQTNLPAAAPAARDGQAGQAGGQAAGRIDGQAAGRIDGQAAGQAGGQAAGQAGGQAAGRIDGQAAGQIDGQAGGQARVGPGVLRPFYPPSPAEKSIPVPAFLLDRLPVTNGEFLAFVQAHPRWQRNRVSRLFADDSYLSRWAGPTALGASLDPAQPVTQVSWYAAKAYCEARGKRLPTESEWELAATATNSSPESRDDLVWRQKLLDWYARPNATNLARVGSSTPNYWGVYDLHGLVWEWVLDFNSSMIGGDNREDSKTDKVRFCGAGALAATDTDDFASFMRLAFRSSLEASYTTANLGFRCAADVKGGQP